MSFFTFPPGFRGGPATTEPIASNGCGKERVEQAHRYWVERGLQPRYIRVLVRCGYLTLDDLQDATDHDIACLPGVGARGREEIYRALGRTPPGRSDCAFAAYAELEDQWRERLGAERFDRLIDDIIEMASEVVDDVTGPGPRALWLIARRRRSSLSS